MRQPQHIPTVIALFLLIIGVGSTVFLVENLTSLFSFAAADDTPQQVSITDVSDSSFTVSWLTGRAVTGSIRYADAGLTLNNTIALDRRDTPSSLSRRRVHSVLVNGLDPTHSYTFEIVSGEKTFASNQYSVKTGPALAFSEQVQRPAYGTLVDGANIPIPEALVISSFEGSQQLATVVEDGNWVLPLGNIRSADGTRHFIPSRNDTQEISFITPKQTSHVVTSVANNAPLPTIQLGRSYSFVESSMGKGVIIAQAQNNQPSSATVNGSTFQISSPLNHVGIPSRKPTIKGTGIPGKSVIVTISGNNVPAINSKVTIDNNGLWSYTPNSLLLPGTYTATALSFAHDNSPLIASVSFTILKSGTQVLQAATPSASVAPSSSPSTPPVTVSPSPSPVLFASPSPSLKPSGSATGSASPSGTTKGGIPVSGVTDITWVLFALGAASLLFGGVVLGKSR
ncbi:hypothetical protein C4579_04730 [Candidatus Microgenomates bacterium]|nr:MAG: hypothetical protein C4579_04730 [Candidatus Microgenomates bacterium]